VTHDITFKEWQEAGAIPADGVAFSVTRLAIVKQIFKMVPDDAGLLQVKAEFEPPMIIDYSADADQRRQLNQEVVNFLRLTYVDREGDTYQGQAPYEELLTVRGLPPNARNALVKALGISVRAEKYRLEQERTRAFRALITEAKKRMRKNGERPVGGIHDAAVAEVARDQGMTADAMKQRLYRHKKRSST